MTGSVTVLHALRFRSRMGAEVDSTVQRWFERLSSSQGLPDGRELPFWLAPLPSWLENIGLRLAWLIVVVNLLGTAFGFWYYRFQFARTALSMWPFVPDSPLATALFACSLAAWKLDAGQWSELIHMLGFFGCIKLGFWTPFVQLALNGPEGIALWLYVFLVMSHLAMVVQAFLITRYASFPQWAIAGALLWHGGNDLVDYFLPLTGDFHHTIIRAEISASGVDHSVIAHDLAAIVAVGLTLLATLLGILTHRALTSTESIRS